MSEGVVARLTSPRLLARNSALNLLGQGGPMVVALLVIPLLIRGLGTDRFGVLTLVWMVIGYFGLFDFGLGRALTRVLSAKIAAGEEEEIPQIAWTALTAMFLMGVVGALLLAASTPALVQRVLAVPAELQREATLAFYLLALSLPAVISMISLQGMLEARQRFGMMNAIRMPISILSYLAPLAILPLTSSLVPIVMVSVFGRTLGWLINLACCLRVFPEMRRGYEFSLRSIRPLARIGGWMTVTNIISPLMTYLDRFLIGALVSVAAVAYYVTPYEVITKLWIIPAAFSGVFFPAFAASFVGNRLHTARLFERGVQVLFIIIFPVAAVLTVFAREGFDAWIPEIAAQSAPVFQWLAAGVFVNCIAQIPFILLQGVGRPDLPAKVHLVELPVYLGFTWWALLEYGIMGAAFAWTLRIVLDTGVMMWLCTRVVPETRRAVAKALGAIVVGLALLGAGTLPITVSGKLTLLGFVAAAWVCGSWTLLLQSEERDWVRARLRRTPADPVSVA